MVFAICVTIHLDYFDSTQISMEENIVANQSANYYNFSPRLQALLDNRIGFGKAQYKLCIPLSFLSISQGAQILIIGLLLPILTHVWNLSTFQQAMGLTVISLGMPIGSILQGQSDNYGRKSMILWDSIILIFFGFLSVFSWNFTVFVITRFFYEIGVGICLPFLCAYTAQISPAHERAPLLGKLWIIWVGGYILSSILGYFLLTHDKWRLVLLILCLPSIFGLITYFMVSTETLHYLWVRKQLHEAHILINKMCKDNNRDPVSFDEVQEQMNEDMPEQAPDQVGMIQLFNQKHKGITVRLMITWLTYYFVYYGITLLLPTILLKVFVRPHSAKNNVTQYLFLVSLAILEILCYVIAPWIMNHPFFGRKKAIYYCNALTFVFSVMVVAFGRNNISALFFFVAMVKIFNSISGLIIYVYTAELYETLLRTKAQGVCALLGRTSVALLGIIGLPATQWLNGTGLYILFALMSLISFFTTYTLPYCTYSAKK